MTNKNKHSTTNFINNIRLINTTLVSVSALESDNESIISHECGLIHYHIGRIDGFIESEIQLSVEETKDLNSLRKTLADLLGVLESKLEEFKNEN